MNFSIKLYCGYIFTCILLVTTSTSYAKPFSDAHIAINQAELVNNKVFNQNRLNDSANFQISVNKETLLFQLQVNKDIFDQENSETQFDADPDFILYKGTIVDKPNSWARFTNRSGVITGAYYDGESLQLILPLSEVQDSLQANSLLGDTASSLDENATVIVNPADIEHNGICALHDHTTSQSFSYDSYVGTLKNMVTDYAGAATKQIKINMVADTEFVSSSANATYEMLENLNIADGIFAEQVNIQIVLNEAVELANNGTLTPTDAVDLIYAFRSSTIENPGVRHLFTGKNLNGSTVGIAFVGSLCSVSSVGLTQRYRTLTSLVFTHELGHNFGSPHDNQSGSACSSVSSGYVMNPNIDGASATFSSCSVSHMEPVIADASSGSSACVSIVEPSDLEITSVANTIAESNVPYSYDGDNTINVEGEGPLTYILDIAPAGMSVSGSGVISWTPGLEDVGSNDVQITVQNSTNRTTQAFSVEVSSDYINLQDNISSYSAESQDKTGGVVFDDNALEVTIEGNAWKQVVGDYVITANTVLEFEFSSQKEGEIHGIGFGNGSSTITSSRNFMLFGYQDCCLQDFRYTADGSTQTFSIPVGQFYTGNFDRLIFINDNDSNVSGVNSTFGNVKIYESANEGGADTLNFNTLDIERHLPSVQDLVGTALVIEGGAGIELTGNKWQRVVINDSAINANTVVEFEFKSTAIGEIHGIGFLNEGEVNSDRTFNLYGTQACCITDYKYTNYGDYQKFVIPVGEYVTQSVAALVFVMDKDNGSPTSNSSFRNIKIYDTDIDESPTTYLNLEDNISSYNVQGQDEDGDVTIDGNVFDIELKGNTWKQLIGDYNITADTILEFEFSSQKIGEIQGIGFANDESYTTPGTDFKLYGTQACCIQNLEYTNIGNTQLFTIPVGQYFTGNFNKLLFINDNDRNISGVNSTYGNVRFYEADGEGDMPKLDFDSLDVVSHLPSVQDLVGTALVIEGGAGLELTGNKWQRVAVNDTVIGNNTVIEFEFKSTVIGEIHGIGFLSEGVVDSSRTFNLYGTQACCISDFKYTQEGDYQKFVIPVGRYLSQSPASLVFVMDKDNGAPTSNSSFRNVKIYDTE